MIKDIVQKNRSYRSFDPNRTITRDELLEFVDIARCTSSSRNIQPLKYRLVCTPEECDRVLSLTAWAGRLKNVKLPPASLLRIFCDSLIYFSFSALRLTSSSYTRGNSVQPPKESPHLDPEKLIQ